MVSYPMAFSVDAACSGNPGRLEYRCIDNRTGQVVFEEGPLQEGTNNVGEFLAIVQALAWCRKRGLSLPIYSDSKWAPTLTSQDPRQASGELALRSLKCIDRLQPLDCS
jgi:ribonuclease HI